MFNIKLFFIFVYFCFSNVDKQLFYKVLSSSSEKDVSFMLQKLNEQKGSNQSAYIGALMIKNAQFQKTGKEKLSMTKKGKDLLEKEILRVPTNVEYRFIRLCIQEHTPEFLNYHQNIEEDKKMIVNAYSKLDQELKAFILNYSKQSKIILPKDLSK